MTYRDIMKPPPWDGEAKTFERIVGYVEELTGFEGQITPEDLLVEDVGLDSLDFLELFFKIQTYVRRELSNKQMNRILALEVSADSISDPDHQGISLYSRLRIRHLVGLVRRQLSNPMEIEGFEYDLWKHRFFPQEHCSYPLEYSWTEWISKISSDEEEFRGYTKKLADLGVETLEYLWLSDDLGYQVIQDHLRLQDGRIDDLESLEKVLDSYLCDIHLLNEIRIKLIKACLVRALDLNSKHDSDSDDWLWIVGNYVDKQLLSEGFDEWIDLDLFGLKLNIEEDGLLRETLRTYMINFIRSKIDQILVSNEEQTDLLQNFLQEEYDVSESVSFSSGNLEQSQMRIVDWYVRSKRSNLINEFRESYQEQLIDEMSLAPQLELYSKNQQIFMDLYNESFVKVSPQKFSDIHEILPDEVYEEIRRIERKWLNKINYLARFPRLGSLEDRILIVLLPDTDWKKVLVKRFSKFKNEVDHLYKLSFEMIHIYRYSIFEELYLQLVLDWPNLIQSFSKNRNSEVSETVEEIWLGIELDIEGILYPALEIILRHGVHVFENWTNDQIIDFFYNPSDTVLSELVNSIEI